MSRHSRGSTIDLLLAVLERHDDRARAGTRCCALTRERIADALRAAMAA
ncbi:hypothetical protein [Frigidibacter sp. MR17.24]